MSSYVTYIVGSVNSTLNAIYGTLHKCYTCECLCNHCWLVPTWVGVYILQLSFFFYRHPLEQIVVGTTFQQSIGIYPCLQTFVFCLLHLHLNIRTVQIQSFYYTNYITRTVIVLGYFYCFIFTGIPHCLAFFI